MPDQRHTPDDLMTRHINRAILKAAVQRAIFDNFTGHVLDMRRAVLIDGECDGKPVMTVMDAEVWEASKDIFQRHVTDLTVIDGRELWPARKRPPKPHSLL